MATQENVVRIGSLLANIAIAADRQFTFVTLTAPGAAEAKVIVPAAEGADCLGVLMDAGVAAGAPCDIAIGGIAKVKAGAVQNGGIKVKTDANGRAVLAAGAAADHVQGLAIDNATAVDQLIRVLLTPTRHPLA